MTLTLHALCITETWIKLGDLSPFTELVPQGCSFLNSPRLTGRDGGLATVFKDSYLCRSLSTGTHSCLDVLLFQLSLVNPVFFAVIYRPPNVNKEFLNEFAPFMSEIVTSYDRILILGDFNIHACCDSKPLSKDFLRLLDSFDFVQWVSGPTHAQGHTLDLILSRGVSVLDIKIEDAGISDHLPILFSVSLDGNTPSQSSLPRRTRIFTDCLSKEFSSKYELLGATPNMNTLTGHLDSNEHLRIFNNNFSNILNTYSIKDEKT